MTQEAKKARAVLQTCVRSLGDLVGCLGGPYQLSITATRKPLPWMDVTEYTLTVRDALDLEAKFYRIQKGG